ncbi:MAG: hypothetical protein ACP5P4_04490 [Steroidobacteraceae bacterium]
MVLLHLSRGGSDFRGDVGRLGQLQQEIEARLRGEVEHVVGVIGGWLIHAAAATRG